MSKHTPDSRAVSIYVLSCPFTGEPRYVGKTRFSVRDRLCKHMEEKPKNYRTKWLQSLKNSGAYPHCEIVEVIPPGGDWVASERSWIAMLRHCGWPLVNGTDGGEGMAGYIMPTETREKLRKANLGKRVKFFPARLCKFCGKEFQFRKGWVDKTRSHGLFCSKNCAWEGKKKQVSHLCKTCGKHFERKFSKGAQYCSKGCAYASRERLAKMVLVRKDYRASDETRRKMSLSARGKPKTPEHRMAIKNALLKRYKSP